MYRIMVANNLRHASHASLVRILALKGVLVLETKGLKKGGCVPRRLVWVLMRISHVPLVH